jgi:hypothetical protein
MSLRSPGAKPRTGRSPLGAVLVCVLACALLAQATAFADPSLQAGAVAAANSHPLTSAVLEQCQTASAESERSATFGGEMLYVPGTVRMQIRIDVLERAPADLRFHAVPGAGIGSWLSSSPGVRVYRLLRQVTNLTAPAAYRGDVHYRWLNARGRVMRATELLTPACQQPVSPVANKPKTAAAVAPVA